MLKGHTNPVIPTYVLLCVGFVSTGALAFLWRTTVGQHSLWLLILVRSSEEVVSWITVVNEQWFVVQAFISGGVDCTTSVVYWPFVSAFKTPYVSALAVG